MELTVEKLLDELFYCRCTIGYLYACLEIPGYKHDHPEETRQTLERLDSILERQDVDKKIKEKEDEQNNVSISDATGYTGL